MLSCNGFRCQLWTDTLRWGRMRMTKQQQQRAQIVLRELDRLVPQAGMILRFGSHWELLVAVQLSAQCTDKKVNDVTDALFKKYRTLDDYVSADPREFALDIFSAGFYRNKTKNILAAAKLVHEQFGGRVPRTMQELLQIPGVGRKTANVVLGNAFGIVEGIAVDTHVRRLARKFGLTTHQNPDKIEQDLLALIPRKKWFHFTYQMIEYGRQYSPARVIGPTDPISRLLIAR